MSLRKSGVRVLAYINPSLDQRGQLFATANRSGYLVRTASGQAYLIQYGTFLCGTVDFTNPDAYAWYKDGKASILFR